MDSILKQLGTIIKSAIDKTKTDLTTLINAITPASIGLGNVDNTSDLNKPISTAVLDALETKQSVDPTIVFDADYVHTDNNYTTVDKTKVGFLSVTQTVDLDAVKIKLDGVEAGATAYIHPTSDGNLHVPPTGTTNYGKVLKSGLTAGSINWSNITKNDVGLNNVDNTSDLDKPISTLVQTSLDTKQPVGNYIVEGDNRLVDSRLPTGTAGGVLSGTYPNPGFAVDMATQAELNSSISSLLGGVGADGNTLAKLRGLISGIQTLLSSDDTNLDTLQEVVAYIKDNKTILDGVTTNKVNVSDIVNVLTSVDTTKPLSAAQGKVLKDLLDSLTTVVSGKQPTLVSGTNIKTVNSVSLLGSGDIATLQLGSSAGAAHGVASAGVATTAAKSDHVHPVQTTISGNAGSATKLETARTIGMTGDVVWTSGLFDGTGNVTGVASLSNSGVTAGSYGTASAIPVITVDSKGRITSITTNSVSIPSGSISVTGGDFTLSGNTGTAITNAALTNTGVTAGTYKSVTVDAKGRVTSGTNPTTLSGYGITDATPSSHIGATGTAHGAATTTVAGFMSSADKTKLDGIATNANNYSHPTSGATAGTYRSVTVDANGHVTAGTNPTTLAGYGITDATPSSHIGAGGTAHANVVAAGASGFMTGADKTKLDGIAAGATNTPLSSVAPSALGVSAVGTGTTAARADHVHSMPTAANVGAVAANTAITAGTATKVTYDAKGLVTAGSSLTATDIPSLDASKITTGTIDLARLPASVVERMVVVANTAAKLALTTAAVQNGDVVKVADTGLMFFVKDDTNLSTEAGYEVFTAGSAATVPWSGVSSKPTTLSGYGITDATPSSHIGATGTAHGAATTTVAGFMSSTDKTKLDGIATGANNYSHPTSGATAGTYKSVTVDANGHVTAGTNPTTLAGYGITDAAASSHVGATGTAHGAATTSVAGFMSSADKTKLDGIANGAQVNVATNLAQGTRTTTTVPITSSTGTTATLDTATTALAGVMSSADKTKLDGIATNANNYSHPTSGATAGTYRSVTVDTNGHVTAGSNPTTLSGYGITDAAPSSHVGSGGVSHTNATTSVAGFMSSTDKIKLDGIEASANKYSLPTASTSMLGGVKIDGTTITINGSGVISSAGGLSNDFGTASIRATAVPVVATTVDCSAGNYFTKTVSGHTSFTFSNVPPSGKAYAFTFEVTYQSGTITWPASVVWPKGVAPVISANKVQLFVFITSNGGITWRGASSIDYAS